MAIDRFQNPDFSLRQLQYAVAVADTGAFGRAAERCGVSQPSLSAQVSKLEDVLQVRLFERGARGVTLTPAGERMLPVIRAALKGGAAVEVAAATLQDPYALPVRIAVIPTVAPYLLPPAVEALRSRTGPAVHWLELQTERAEEAVAQGRADAMIIADPPTVPDLVDRALGWEHFVAVVPRGSQGPTPVPVDWLASRSVLLLEQGHCLREHAMALCHLSETSESPFRSTSLATLVQMVSAGLGVSVLPAMAVGIECARARIDAREFASGTIGRTLRLAWREHHPQHEVLEELAEVLTGATARAIAEGSCS